MIIKDKIRTFFKIIFDKFDISITSKTTLDRLKRNQDIIEDYALLKYIQGSKNKYNYLKNLAYSNSQLKQDLFVLSHLGFKENGFFCRVWGSRWDIHFKYLLTRKKI